MVGVYVAGGMHGGWAHVWRGGGCAWQGACVGRYYEIRSMRRAVRILLEWILVTIAVQYFDAEPSVFSKVVFKVYLH